MSRFILYKMIIPTPQIWSIFCFVQEVFWILMVTLDMLLIVKHPTITIYSFIKNVKAIQINLHIIFSNSNALLNANFHIMFIRCTLIHFQPFSFFIIGIWSARHITIGNTKQKILQWSKSANTESKFIWCCKSQMGYQLVCAIIIQINIFWIWIFNCIFQGSDEIL